MSKKSIPQSNVVKLTIVRNDRKSTATGDPINPRDAYDLDFVRDLRDDLGGSGVIEWWKFDRAGGDSNWAGDGSFEQGEEFFRQIERLTKNNSEAAENSIIWSLMNMTGSVSGVGFKGCELRFCENIAKAAIAFIQGSPRDSVVQS